MILKPGMKLIYKGYETSPSVKIKSIMLPGYPRYDGAMCGISFQWLKRPRRPVFFYPCKSIEEFLQDYRFRNLVEQ